MTKDVDVARLVSGLMAAATTAGEKRAIAVLADARLFEDPDFRRSCIRPGGGVVWRRVREMWVRLPENDARRPPLEDSTLMATLADARQPESLEELQIRIGVDGPGGIVLAAWRDAYAADPRDPNPYHHHIDLCVDELRHRFECWNCGRPAVDMTEHDLPVCTICKENS